MRMLPIMAAILLLGCTPEGALPRRALSHTRTIITPSLSDDADMWLSRPQQIKYDSVTGNLLVADLHDIRVNEFTTDGELIRQYGKHGEGPGEIGNLRAFGFGPDHVTILDPGNGKISSFSRQTGKVRTEILLDRFIYDLTAIGDTIVLLPGGKGAVFDLVDLNGNLIGSFGDGGFLPRYNCTYCYIRHIGADRIVVIQGTIWKGRLFGLDGTFRGIFSFNELREVIWQWEEQFNERLRRSGVRIAQDGHGRVSSGKGWIADVVPYSEGKFYVTATPERLNDEPWEVWLMDSDGRITDRFAFDRTWTGATAASFPRVFAVGQHDFAIYEFHAELD